MHPLDSSKSCQQQELYIVVVCHIMHVSWNQPLPWMSSLARLKIVLSNSHNPTPPHSPNHNHTPRPNNPLTQLASQTSVSQSALYSRSHEDITSPENTRSNSSVTTIDDHASQISKTLSPPCTHRGRQTRFCTQTPISHLNIASKTNISVFTQPMSEYTRTPHDQLKTTRNSHTDEACFPTLSDTHERQ